MFSTLLCTPESKNKKTKKENKKQNKTSNNNKTTHEYFMTSLVNKIRAILEPRAYILKLNFFITYLILYNAFCH